MIRTFKSKIDKWYHLLIWVILLLLFYFMWNKQIASALVLLIVGVFLLESLLRTEYIFMEDGYLLVKSGFMPKYRIPIEDIVEVKYIRSTRLAYALSADRLLLVLPYDTRMVSPENPEDFILQLRKFNHHVQVSGRP